MRNTFVKLFLALAVCFMIGSALVACGGNFELTVSDDGYFVVNGEKTDIKQGDSVEDCAHEVQKFEVKAHTADADGVVLEVCTKCDDYAKVTAGTIHNYVEGEIAATCTAAGFKGEICSVCGNHGENGTEIKAAGHKFGENVILTSVGAACVEGGVAVKHCSVCKYVTEPEAVGPVGHVVKVWSIDTYPTEDSVGYAKGDCQYCDGEKVYELPALNEEDYTTAWKDNKAPTCYEEGTKVYTYVVKNQPNNETDNLYDNNIKLEAEGVADTAEHVLAGKPVDTWYDMTKKAYLYYADTNGDGSTEAVGFLQAANATTPLSCDTIGKAYFICEACDLAVIDLDVYKAHFGAESIVDGKIASCHTPGLKKIACVNCVDINPDGVQIAYTVPHNIEYKLSNINVAAKTGTLEGKCHNKKTIVPAANGKPAVYKECWELSKDVIEATPAGEEIAQEYLGWVAPESVSAKKISTTKSTCYQLGYDTYQCEVKVDSTTTVNVTANNPHDSAKQPAHTLNGKLLTAYKGENKITTSTKGIMPIAGDENKFEICGKTYKACFVCDVCAAYIAASGSSSAAGSLVVLENVEMPHSDIEDETKSKDAKDATCVTAGVKFVKCVNAMCPTKGETRAEVIPALGHDYSTTYSVDAEKNELTLEASCTRNCKEYFATFKEVVDLDTLEGGLKDKIKSKATCTTLDVTTYSGTIDFVVNPTIVPVLDEDGNPVYVQAVDENGDPVVDEDGNPVYVQAVDENGDPVVDEDGNPVYEIKTEWAKDKDGNYIPDVTVSVATKKEVGNGFVEEDLDGYYLLSITYDKQTGKLLPHTSCAEEDFETVVYNRDWDKDGVIDAIETYTFSYCVNCFTPEQESLEIEQLTDVTEAPDEDEE